MHDNSLNMRGSPALPGTLLSDSGLERVIKGVEGQTLTIGGIKVLYRLLLDELPSLSVSAVIVPLLDICSVVCTG